MKKVLVFLAIAVCFISCDKGKGNLELTVSYYFNDYQGYKPDVAAHAYLFDIKIKDEMCLDSMNYYTAMIGRLVGKDGEWLINEINDKYDYLYDGEADANGVLRISDINVGKYIIMLSSKGREIYSIKDIEIKKGETLFLTKNFGYLNDWKTPEYW